MSDKEEEHQDDSHDPSPPGGDDCAPDEGAESDPDEAPERDETLATAETIPSDGSPVETIPSNATVFPPARVRGSIGGYTVVGELGQGGMGVVFRALDPTLHRSIAIKLLPEELSTRKDWLERFEQEARLLASINHPNIATIYSLEQEDETRFLTLELIEGPDLSERLSDGPLTVDETLSIGRQIAAALEAAHDRGVVHLDVKPGNIKLGGYGTVKVLDFGLASAVQDGKASPHQRSGRRVQWGGTPGYMSPEQVDGEDLDARSDVWSFGCVLFECLAGKRPYRGNSITEILGATVAATPDWTELPAIPAELERTIRSCLTRDLSSRTSGMREIRLALDHEIESRKRVSATAPSMAREAETPHNVPNTRSSLVAREAEESAAARALEKTSILTLAGAGGCGKTRLAIEVARRSLERFPDGVWWVELATLREAHLLLRELGRVLEVQEQRGKDLLDSIVDRIGRGRVLLVLDNCEHMLDATSEILRSLLAACPELRVLTTSREPLSFPEETVLRIAPLAVPEARTGTAAASADRILESGAVRLFVERAQSADPSFAVTQENIQAIATVCAGLDGIPLALELAAARLQVLSVSELADRLDQRFRILRMKRAKLEHHQTLSALIGWSYDQLEPLEQQFFRRLSVFDSGWTLDAAESVCGGGDIEIWDVLDLLSELVDKSLVEVNATKRHGQDSTRYRMLQTVRQYASEMLSESGEFSEMTESHLQYIESFVEEAAPELTGKNASIWFRRIEADLDNIRGALQAARTADSTPTRAARLVVGLWHFWIVRGHWTEGRSLAGSLLEKHFVDEENLLRARLQHLYGNLLWSQGDYDQAETTFEEAATMYRNAGAENSLGGVLNGMGSIAMTRGQYAKARACGSESLEIGRRRGEERGIAVSLSNLGSVAFSEGELEEAEALHGESLEIRRKIGERRAIAASLSNLGAVYNARGEIERAAEAYEESLDISREVGDQTQIAVSSSNLGNAHIRLENEGKARACLLESLEVYETIGDRRGMAFTLSSIGLLEASIEQSPRAVTILTAADRLWEAVRAQLAPAGRQQIDDEFEKLRVSIGDGSFGDASALGNRIGVVGALELARSPRTSK